VSSGGAFVLHGGVVSGLSQMSAWYYRKDHYCLTLGL
jgi:hypothetical protein